MKLSYKLDQYRAMIDATLAAHNLKRDDLTEGWQAWRVAGKAGVLDDAYSISRDITDGHIQTALQTLMPRVAFKDKKVY